MHHRGPFETDAACIGRLFAERDALRDQLQVYVDREAANQLAVDRDIATHNALALLKERDALKQRVDDLLAAIARVEEWTHEHGAALHPRGADTYGNGMRDAKEQVGKLLHGVS